ncbi:MAG: SMP-30/gluconolactonase/LRE family protein [Deltaproteobacteria bacterium]|nr:SMP-30/gluconolactonase/LRE family protein [Deltaproteobacteria bacterium]
MSEVVTITAKKIADGYVFGEGIRWTGSDVVLSDMIGQRVITVDSASGGVETLYALEGDNRPNGLVCMDDGSLLILSMFEKKILRLKEGEVSIYADLSEVVIGYLGDVVMDTRGNLYVDDVGVRPFHGEAMASKGRIIFVKPNGDVSILLENLGFPNGITISPDGKTLYLAETLLAAVHAYDIADDGSLNGRRLHVSLGDLYPDGKGWVDGMGIDDDEGIWVCLVNSNEVERFNKAGELTHRVNLPGINPVACTIGGPDGKTLYITGTIHVEGTDHLEELVAGRVRSTVWEAKVPFSNAKARP